MNQPIKRLLEDKMDGFVGEGGIIHEDDRMNRYPIDYIVDGEYRSGFLQDAIEHTEPNLRSLILIILRTNMEEYDTVRMICTIPQSDCIVNWDTVTCAESYEFNTENEGLKLDEDF